MEQIRFLKILIGVLIFFNLSLLAFFLINYSRPHHPPSHHHKNHVEDLQMDKNQKAIFKKAVDIHKHKMDSINKAQGDLLEPYFLTIAGKPSALNQADALEFHLKLEQQKIEVTYHNFSTIKTALNPEQLPAFEVFLNAHIQKILGKRKKMPPPPKDF